MSSHSDFDFLIGDWNVHNRRLTNPLSGTDVWYEFQGTSKAHHLWDGSGNMDEYVGNSPGGLIQGLTVRLFDPAAKLWRLYWATHRDGMFGTPTIGAFTNGRGEFFDHELFQEKSIFVRYVWTVGSRTACRWEQAFSADGGTTWETNWVMDFSRS